MTYTTTDSHESGASIYRVERGCILQGLKAICGHVGKCETTVRKLINEEGLPATKEGGEWISDTELIRAWRLKRLQG